MPDAAVGSGDVESDSAVIGVVTPGSKEVKKVFDEVSSDETSGHDVDTTVVSASGMMLLLLALDVNVSLVASCGVVVSAATSVSDLGAEVDSHSLVDSPADS